MSSSNNINNNNSEICNFYRNKSIFITGATGFLGKALIEKLLRSCYDLNKIYILIRHKKGKTPAQRLDEFLDCKVFEKVSQFYPEYRDKLVVIEGDLVEPNLGISEKDREILRKNVNVVFHSAATVRFDEPLKVAISMNILGTKKVIDLCKEIENLKIFVHVSTAYANCDRPRITEEVYPPPVQPEKIIEAAEWMDDSLINLITPSIIKNRPNTYTYTKAIAESLIIKECKEMPCCIVRPSIIGGSWKEPFAGWIDNFNGPTALFPASGTGVLRSMLGHLDAVADLIPVDVVVNTLLAAGWYRGVERTKKTIVYHCTSGQINKLTWGMMNDYGVDCFLKNPFEKIFIVPNPHFTPHKSVKYLRTFFEQLIPAYLMDFFLRLLKRKPMFVKIQKKIKKAITILEYFTTHNWEFTNDNYLMLMKELNDPDKKMFNFDIKDLNWRSYIEQYCLGTKIFLMKEDVSNLNACRKNIEKMKRIQNLAIFSIYAIVFRFILLRSARFKTFIQFIFELAIKFRDYFLKSIQF
ncbi:unnamed protein product [Brachionus calyciflorus]|uniref:Fatty acyl-CoA reductase n=1 Tax=Brachionus calyciflorus TaxID=104777 RepID=A0A813WRJ7_9BILA|nr:unnamed protein product [Brachionus calyciflorus]